MNFKNLSVLLLASGLLVSCNLSGIFTVHDDIQLKDKKGNLINISAGKYEAKIKRTRFGKNRVRLKFVDHGEKRKIYFRLPKGMKLPDGYGSIQVPSAVNGQNYDLAGLVDSDITESPPTHGYESCVYDTRPVRRCRRVCSAHDRWEHGHGHCYRDCWWDRENIYGRREIVYHYVYTDEVTTYSLTEPGTLTPVLAEFVGIGRETERVVDSYGRCRRI